jgi:hypothetical protein
MQIPSGHKLREATAPFDAISDWSISFRYPVDDPLQAEPLPEPSEVVAWVQRIDAVRGEVVSLFAAPHGRITPPPAVGAVLGQPT